jgi:hypothetical protein
MHLSANLPITNLTQTDLARKVTHSLNLQEQLTCFSFLGPNGYLFMSLRLKSHNFDAFSIVFEIKIAHIICFMDEVR